MFLWEIPWMIFPGLFLDPHQRSSKFGFFTSFTLFALKLSLQLEAKQTRCRENLQKWVCTKDQKQTIWTYMDRLFFFSKLAKTNRGESVKCNGFQHSLHWMSRFLTSTHVWQDLSPNPSEAHEKSWIMRESGAFLGWSPSHHGVKYTKIYSYLLKRSWLGRFFGCHSVYFYTQKWS